MININLNKTISEEELEIKFQNAKSYNEMFATLVTMRKIGIDIEKYIEQIEIHKRNIIIKHELKILPLINKKNIEKRFNVNYMTEDEQIIAISRNKNLAYYIENPSEKIQKIIDEIELENNKDCIDIEKLIKNASYDEQLDYLKSNGLNLQYIETPSLEMQLEAVKQNGCAIEYIHNPKEKIQLVAVDNDSMAIKYIKSPTLKVMLKSVTNDPMSIQYMIKVPLEIQFEAVKIDGSAIKYINEPILEVQVEAIKNNPESIKFIKNVHEDSIKLYEKMLCNDTPIIDNTIQGTNHETNILHDNINFVPDYNEIFSMIPIDTCKSFIINGEDALNDHINYLCKSIDAKEINIATGYVFKSGLDLVDKSFQYVTSNFGEVKLIIGSLQEYNNIYHQKLGKITGMDMSTAIYINSILEKGIKIKTFQEFFYHGKFYLLKGQFVSCVIIGSSNVSGAGFNSNKELNVLFIGNNDDTKIQEFIEWFNLFWDLCLPIDRLEAKFFNYYEREINIKRKTDLVKVEDSYVNEKISYLSDEQLRKRLKIWLSKSPDNIYTDLGIYSLENYLLFEYKDFNLIVLESFEPNNSYYYFYDYNINDLLTILQTATKTEIFNLSSMQKRGYHIKNNVKMEIEINSLFVKRYNKS